VIGARRAQLTFGDRLIAEEVDGLYEDWMVHADAALADDDIVTAAYEALAKRHPMSRTRGRRGYSAEVGRAASRSQTRAQLELCGS
jgi:transposase, IS5 family